jgi:hypothetical protein
VAAAHRPNHGIDVAGGAAQRHVEQYPLGGLCIGDRVCRSCEVPAAMSAAIRVRVAVSVPVTRVMARTSE